MRKLHVPATFNMRHIQRKCTSVEVHLEILDVERLFEDIRGVRSC